MDIDECKKKLTVILLLKRSNYLIVGFKANLILTKNEPTKDLSILKNPDAIMKNGHWLIQDALNLLREHAIEQQRWWPELGVLVSNY